MWRNLRTLSLLLILPLALAVGCKTSSTQATPPLAPGYANSADQTMGQTLLAARAFYNQVQQDVQTGKYTLSQGERTTFQTFGTTLNVAMEEYLAYHNGLATEAQAQAAVNAVTAQQSQLQAIIPSTPAVKPQSSTPMNPDPALSRG